MTVAEAEVEDAATRFAAGFSAPAGLHAVPQAPVGMARAGVCLWR